ncbi:hypothetical protein [Kitasatospora sp. NE20-6]|uniref:hypothetical protein n=1 Tax=Kitasatospora sp. NE20-6 TaxID=2859066 RepID=UPI0038B31536
MAIPYMSQGQDPVGWVTEAYPRPLRYALSRRGGVPHTVRTVIAGQLRVRTADQLRERIERRWFGGFAHLPAPELLERADDIAMQLVGAPGCEVSLRCEDGWLLDQDANCMWCRPSRTEFHMRDEDLTDGRRSSAETVARMAAEIRTSMRTNRRYPNGPRR